MAFVLNIEKQKKCKIIQNNTTNTSTSLKLSVFPNI